MKQLRLATIAALAVSVLYASPTTAQLLPMPQGKADGTIVVPDFELPFSSFASEEAREAFGKRLTAPSAPPSRSLAEIRASSDAKIALQLEISTRLFPYTSMKSMMNGVPVETFIPKGGIAPANRNRVLIQVHGGGMVAGGGGLTGAAESVPIAGTARMKVVAVDYRLQPENPHPAQVEDMEKVYRELLKTYRPANIGIYGCSAGGSLSAWAPQWFLSKKLPLPGALGVFCSSLYGSGGGDSAQLWPRMGSVLALIRPAGSPGDPPNALNPRVPDAVIAAFPPTLLLTGTRAPEMSGAVQSHLVLQTAGRKSQLLLFDGMDHGFYSDATLPESRRAYALIARFFMENLGRKPRRAAKPRAIKPRV